MMIKILWEKKAKSFDWNDWFRPSILIDVASTLYGFLLLVGVFSSSTWLEALWMSIEALASFAIGVFNFRYITRDYLLSKSVNYMINENAIVFTWGILNRRREVIPFVEIDRIVWESGAASPAASMLIYSRKMIDLLGYDQSISKRRTVPAIEDVPEMDDLVNIIQNVIKRQGVNVSIIDKRGDKLERRKYVGENVNVARNLLILRTYLFVFVLAMLYFIDCNILSNSWSKDSIVWAKAEEYPKAVIAHKYSTSKGRTFVASKFIGRVGDELELGFSPIYGTLNGLIIKDNELSKTIMSGFKGVSKLLYLTTCLFLIVGALCIDYSQGIVLGADIGFAFVFPITFLGLSLLNWLYMNIQWAL